MYDDRLALFMLLGKAAQNEVVAQPEISTGAPLLLAEDFDLATTLVEQVSRATHAAEAYRLFFVFERYLRQLVLSVLVEQSQDTWWDNIPQNVRDDVEKLESKEASKEWMGLEAREKLALATFRQLIAIIEQLWDSAFAEIVRDKALIHEARLIAHLRNTICHMSDVPDEEIDRVKLVMRDWFRIAPP